MSSDGTVLEIAGLDIFANRSAVLEAVSDVDWYG